MTALVSPPTTGSRLALQGIVDSLRGVAERVAAALQRTDDWKLPGQQAGQYRFDVVADRMGVAELRRLGYEVLSEESGLRPRAGALRVYFDPVDGSINASRRLTHYGPSLCAVDEEGPLAAIVLDASTGEEFWAARGRGAWRNGIRLQASRCRSLSEATVALSGHPPSPLGWAAARGWGAAAFELCAVAAGGFDAFIDWDAEGHGPWDYLGGLLMCTEAGAVASDACGRHLVPRAMGERRRPIVAATPELLESTLAALRPEPQRSIRSTAE